MPCGENAGKSAGYKRPAASANAKQRRMASQAMARSALVGPGRYVDGLVGGFMNRVPGTNGGAT